jgi:hypothetical protein
LFSRNIPDIFGKTKNMKKLVLLFAIVGLLFPPVMSIASNDGGDSLASSSLILWGAKDD